MNDETTQQFIERIMKESFDKGYAKAKEDVLNEVKSKLYRLDWITIFKNAYENRKTSWEGLGHIREWRNATDEVMSEVIKQLFESIKENSK